MNLKYKQLLYLLITSSWIGCSSPKLNQEFTGGEKIKGIIHINKGLYMPTEIKLFNEKIVLIDNDGINLISVFDKKTLKNRRFIKKGRGPNEMLSPFYLHVNNSQLNIFDLKTQTIATCEFLSDSLTVINTSRSNNENSDYVYSFLSDRNTIVGTGNNTKGTVCINDLENNQQYTVGKYPLKEDKTVEDFVHTMACQSRIVKSPTNNKLFVAGYYQGFFQIFDKIEDKWEMIKEKHYFKSPYDRIARNGHALYSINKNTKYAFIDLKAKGEYVYALFSGRTEHLNPEKECFGNIIIVYNWSGDIVKKYKLDKDILSFAVDNDCFYGVSYNPEPIIYKFKT